MKRREIKAILIGISSLFLFVTPVFAHVIVYPHQVGIAEIQDFTVSVPNERDTPVTSVRLLIPRGVSLVVPDATQNWTITTRSTGSGDEQTISEIDWTNGSIPVGQREELIFQAQAPATPTTIAWKAYQTYSDGTVVSWNVNPATVAKLSDVQQDQLADKENKGEYSTTQVLNDLAAGNAQTALINSAAQTSQFAEVLSGVAILLGIFAVYLAWRKQ